MATEVQLTEHDFLTVIGKMTARIAELEIYNAALTRTLSELHMDLPDETQLMRVLYAPDEASDGT